MGKIIFVELKIKKISPRSLREIFVLSTNQLKEILKHDKNQVDYPYIVYLNMRKFNSVIQIL